MAARRDGQDGRDGRRAGGAAAATTWSVYVLRCADGRLYTGIATDVARRIRDHAGRARGAKSLRDRGPFELVLEAAIGDRGPALRVERRIKALPKAEKERLLRSPALRRSLLDGVKVTLRGRARPDDRAAGARSRRSSRPARPASAR